MSGYLEDLSQQVEDANEAARGEVSSQRDEDWADIYDDRPNRAELERNDEDDYAWWLEQEERPDPWGHLPAIATRQHAAIPTDPPF